MASERRHVSTVVVVRPPLQQLAACIPISQNRSVSDDTSLSHTIHCSGNVETSSKDDSNFTFPKVYGYEAEDLANLAANEVEQLLIGALNGESAAIIVYGATGAGKSFLCGTEHHKMPSPNSIGPYIARRLWPAAKEQGLGNSLSVEVSFLEIYREGQAEAMYDLLRGFSRTKLQGYQKETVETVKNGDELLQKLIQGADLRNTDATDGNARSSRSHAIFTCRITAIRGRDRISSRLWLVDLAGAEAAAAAAPNTQQQRQGSGINVGLSTLQTVIREVAEQGNTMRYRDSKLTFILKPALGGEGGTSGCTTLFIGAVSPLLADLKRTQNTLQYVQQAGRIKNRVAANVEALEASRERALLRERDGLKEKLTAMALELEAAKEALRTTQNNDTVSNDGVRIPSAASTSDVVVLSVDEHEELLGELKLYKDRVAALEVVLQRDQQRFVELQRAMEDKEEDTTLSTPIAPPNTARDHTPMTALSPALAALAVSPILSAAAGVDATSWNSQATNGVLEVEDIILPQEEAHLSSDQYSVLSSLVQRRLGDDSAEDGSTNQIAALRLAVAAYNECLGSMVGEVALANERAAEAESAMYQAAREKVQYVELVAKYNQALDLSQFEVSQLDSQLKLMKRASVGSPEGRTPVVGGLLGRLLGSGGKKLTLDASPSKAEELQQQATPEEIVHKGEPGVGSDPPRTNEPVEMRSLSPFPLEDLGLNDDDEDEVVLVEEKPAIIDLTQATPPLDNDPTSSEDDEETAARTASKLNGGVNSRAISDAREGQVSEQYVKRNRHWKRFEWKD